MTEASALVCLILATALLELILSDEAELVIKHE